MMKVLLTSGGTKVKIDRVRHIGNMSKGTFGSMIGRQLSSNGNVHHLTFLHAKNSKTPFAMNVQANTSSDVVLGQIGEVMRLHDLRNAMLEHAQYEEVPYETFEDYEVMLMSHLEYGRPDVVILAAAVSDFLVDNYVDGKVRSKDAMTIQLTPADKLIGRVRGMLPDCRLIGFKLLVDSTDSQLIEAARKSLEENGCDAVIANDLRDIESREHRIIVVENGSVNYWNRDLYNREFLAEVVADLAVRP